ncbi:PREDICTED: muscarinic acetylcholine receptor M1-like [Priapulus caudatus]|uniref:Muscarinic acetylcholine receptor M1-like n=1 Tax=Priapulus caudatus TaxID=37621 RepID=A0ABM1E506_PRICU|nr:PREDICTED: muscarinic acetylcholine receptor M1-like [Priapulus caudatus]
MADECFMGRNRLPVSRRGSPAVEQGKSVLSSSSSSNNNINSSTVHGADSMNVVNVSELAPPPTDYNLSTVATPMRCGDGNWTSACGGNDTWPTDVWANASVVVDDSQVFTLWQIVVIGVLVGALSLATVSGNILVLASFYVERSIRQPTNYFIASLAISDLLIGLLSMPLYTQSLVLKGWRLGQLVCDIWLSVDYTVCLASQYTVLCITIDRFCSVKFPARYRNWRTQNKVRWMVVLSWLIPMALFFTCIFGWPYFVDLGVRDTSQCSADFLNDPVFNTILIFSYYWDSLIVLTVLYIGIYKVAWQLQKKSEAKYKRMTSMVAMASGHMTKVGIGISKTQGTLLDPDSKVKGGAAGNSNASSTNNKTSSGKSATETTSFASKQDESQQERSSSPVYPSDQEDDSSSDHARTASQKKTPPKEGKHKEGGKATKADKAAAKRAKPSSAQKKMLKISPPPVSANNVDVAVVSAKGAATKIDDVATPPAQPADANAQLNATTGGAQEGSPERAQSLSYKTDQESVQSPSTESFRTTSVPLSPNSAPSSKEPSPMPREGSPYARDGSPMQKEGSPTVVTTKGKGKGAVTRVAKPDEVALLKEVTPPRYSGDDNVTNGKTVSPERSTLLSLKLKIRGKKKEKAASSKATKREKSKSENRARKALRTITCIMGAFVLCWTPWHICATILGFCPTCVNADLYSFSYWLCYMNSPLNPFMYALANVQFKKTFVRMLKGDWKRR